MTTAVLYINIILEYVAVANLLYLHYAAAMIRPGS